MPECCYACSGFKDDPHICPQKNTGFLCGCKSKQCFSLKEVSKNVTDLPGSTSSYVNALKNYVRRGLVNNS